MYDVIIIGAGVAGSASARELSRYQAKICVLEKEEDVCCGTSKANSAIVHAGYDAAEGSLMARLNVRGNEMMEQLSKDLDFPFKRNGSLVVCLHKDEMSGLKTLYKRGIANGTQNDKGDPDRKPEDRRRQSDPDSVNVQHQNGGCSGNRGTDLKAGAGGL